MWECNGMEIKSHADIPLPIVGFIYEITYTNGQKYVGKKLIRSIRKKKPTKSQLAIRKNFSRKEMTNLPFLKYEGSSQYSEGLTVAKKEILMFCFSKKQLSYFENRELYARGVLFDDNYLNANVEGKYFLCDFTLSD